jgi:hypothetical protein
MRIGLAALFCVCLASASFAQVPKVEVPELPQPPAQQQAQGACAGDSQCCCNVLNQFQCTSKSICETTGGKCEADDKCK